MVKLLCKCGEVLGTSDCPSPYDISVYYESEITTALHDLPEIQLEDFIADVDEKHHCRRYFMVRPEKVVYWFCPKCKRVYEVQAKPYGKSLRTYTRVKPIPASVDISKWRRIYVLTDSVTETVLDKRPYILLSEFLSERIGIDPIVYLSPDEKEVRAFDPKSPERCIFAYKQEE